MQDYTSKTIQFEGCTIVIHRPVLSSAERAKREDNLKTRLGHTLRDYVNRKDKTA